MQQEFHSKYDVQHTLGSGAFSDVKLAVVRATGQKLAVKIIDRLKCKGKEDMIDTEIRILQRIDHPNIVKLYEMYEFDGKIYLLMELVTGGELFDEIVSRGSLPEKEAAAIVKKMLEAILYLHSKGVVHRDLKPENLLLAAKGTGSIDIKISDFGLSKIFDEVEVMKTACGTPGYVAPEVLRRQGYGQEVDLWSLGVITYIILCGYPPFFDQKNAELFKKIMGGKFQFDAPWWDHISERAKDFIRRLLVVDCKKRFTAAEALAHPFITGISVPVKSAEARIASVSSSAPVKTVLPEIRNAPVGPSHRSSPPANKTNPIAPLKEPNPIPIADKKDAAVVSSNDTVYVDDGRKAQQQSKKPLKSSFSVKVSRLASWIRTATTVDKKR